MKTITAKFTTKQIVINEHELNMITNKNEMCLASAKDILMRSGIDFDDIERLNNVFKNHKWGSNADRKYRKAAINKAVKAFATNPLNYLSL